MKLNFLKKYIFINILSIFGYISFITLIYYFAAIKPAEDVWTDKLINQHGEALLSLDTLVVYYFVYFLILAFILFCFLVEFLIRKKNKFDIFKFSENKIYSIFFWIGIFGAILPLVLSLPLILVFLVSLVHIF